MQFSANDIAKEHKRKKITEGDVYQALKEMGFEKYVEELKDFMVNFNEEATAVQSKPAAKKRTIDREGAGASEADPSEDIDMAEGVAPGQASKKLKRVADLGDEDVEIVDI